MKVTAVAFTFAALASATLAVPVLSSEQSQGMYRLTICVSLSQQPSL